ncbi:MAG: clostripain-related cysteine peptidase [Fimbriimonadales bacterium]
MREASMMRPIRTLLVLCLLAAGCGGGGVPITHTKWTVIVFMNAANNLFPDSTVNMNQMEMVASNPQVRFVVEWKQASISGGTFNSTRRYLVRFDTTNAIKSQLVQDLGPGYDMGSAAHLLAFIDWAKANYPADRYCLVIWNHGNGWTRAVQSRGVSYDDETGNHIDTWQLTQALGGSGFDIIAWDASLMQQLEVDDEIRDQATYIVGSEESPPAAGYPYDKVFAHFRDNPDAPTLTLAKAFVDETLLSYGGSTFNITQSVIDTSQLAGLATATSNLADVLSANVATLGIIIPEVRTNAQGYSDSGPEHRLFRDLYGVGLELENFGAPAPVITAEQAVRTAITQAVVYEGHNALSPGSHGISIDFHAGSVFTASPPTPTLALDYQNLRFGQETHWGSWLSIAP